MGKMNTRADLKKKLSQASVAAFSLLLLAILVRFDKSVHRDKSAKNSDIPPFFLSFVDCQKASRLPWQEGGGGSQPLQAGSYGRHF